MRRWNVPQWRASADEFLIAIRRQLKSDNFEWPGNHRGQQEVHLIDFKHYEDALAALDEVERCLHQILAVRDHKSIQPAKQIAKNYFDAKTNK